MKNWVNNSPHGSQKHPTRSPQGSNKNPTWSTQGSHKEPTRIPQICTRTWKCLRVTLAFSLVLVVFFGNCDFLVRRLVTILVGILESLRNKQFHSRVVRFVHLPIPLLRCSSSSCSCCPSCSCFSYSFGSSCSSQ